MPMLICVSSVSTSKLDLYVYNNDNDNALDFKGDEFVNNFKTRQWLIDFSKSI